MEVKQYNTYSEWWKNLPTEKRFQLMKENSVVQVSEKFIKRMYSRTIKNN